MKCTVEDVIYKSKQVLHSTCIGCAGGSEVPRLCAVGCNGIIWVESKNIKVDGKTYKPVKEKEEGKCTGCATIMDSRLCQSLNPGNECCEKKIIWVERVKKPKVDPKAAMDELVAEAQRDGSYDVAPDIEARLMTEAWVNVYAGFISSINPTKEAADQAAGCHRLACVRIEY